MSDRLKEASDQLDRSLRDEPATARGIIAISLQPILNPDAKVLEIADLRQAAQAMDRWLTNASGAVRPQVEKLFDRGRVVLVQFYASHDFLNLASGRLERAAYVVGRVHLPPRAPYRSALEDLKGRLEARKKDLKLGD